MMNKNGYCERLFCIILLLALCMPFAIKADDANQFEALRTKLASWVDNIKTDIPIKSSRYAKGWIVDQWESQKEDYLILSVQTIKEFNHVHIPHATNIPYKKILSGHYLDNLDSLMTFVIYSDNGYTGVSTMVLMNLLDYKTYSLKFGMMDWNRQYVTGEVWKKSHNLPVSHDKAISGRVFKYPVINQTNTSLSELIRSRYTSNVLDKVTNIPISDVKNILQHWESNKSNYQVVSVRRNKDYKVGHISNAINIPMFELMDSEQLRKLDPDKILLVYCDTGHLSELSTTLLNLLGYNAKSIVYGMMGWNDKHIIQKIAWDGVANYPVVYNE